jgi:ATP-binding cassette, subfamily C (CFTR/MRP), member 4
LTKSTQVDGLQGKVINLLSNDLSKFDLALAFLHDLWKGPFEVFLLGFLTYREMGFAGVIGIIFILSFIPIQCKIKMKTNLKDSQKNNNDWTLWNFIAFIGKMATTFRMRTTKRADIRVRMMNEIINGIQIIKFYAWERNFAKVVADIRKKELRAVRGTNYIMALIYSLWAVSRVSLFLTLITYVYHGNVLTARKVFIVSAYYNILQESMVNMNFSFNK